MSTIGDRLADFAPTGEQLTAWRPRVFDLARAADAEALTALLDAGRVRSVHDELMDQLRDLAEARRPGTKGEPLEQAALALLGETPAEQYGVWVLYPWSGALVHLLPPSQFRELRTNRNRHKITHAEQETLRGLSIGVVGLSVGQATAMTLAMEGVGGSFRIADFDRLSLSNLNRLRAGVHDLGVPKVWLTARMMFELDPFLDISIFEEGVTADNLDRFLAEPRPLDLVAEECDDLGVKLLVRERARAFGIPVLMETSDRGMLDIERFDLEPERPSLHGLVGDIRAEQLDGMTTYEKVPTVLRMIGPQTVSERMAVSMLDVESTLASWPQLASAVALGGAVVTDTARRIALGELRTSGRFYVDLPEIIGDDTPGRERHVAPFEVAQAPTGRVGAPPIVRADGDSPTHQQLRDMVAHGILAPSGGNCQPWRFALHEGRIDCFHQVEHSRSMLDFGNLASYLSFGAVVENMVLAAAGMGLAVDVHPFPHGQEPALVCSLDVRRDPGIEASALLAHVDGRTTNRKVGVRKPLDPAVALALAAAAEERGARLQLVTDDAQLEEIAAVLGRGERLRLVSETMHREMMSEIRWTTQEAERTRDGLDVATLELTPTDLAGMQLISSWPLMQLAGRLGTGDGLGRPTRKAIAGACAVGLVTFEGTDPTHYFEAGRATQRTWLTAASHGLAFQPMTALLYLFARLIHGGAEGLSRHQVDELSTLRRRLGGVFELSDGHAEGMVFRLAHADPPSGRALRRDVDAFLDKPSR
ncbi:MAG: Rv1355c family protein [Deltaproteobacteria bacterium]|nr:Rv1355c family protein [Deltaproteobacteria bacterium]